VFGKVREIYTLVLHALQGGFSGVSRVSGTPFGVGLTPD